MRDMGIKAVAITGASRSADFLLWKKVDRGEFQIVSARPEALLGPRAHFYTTTVRTSNAFMLNLAAIVVDECHLIHHWREFRKLYMALCRLRKCCKGVPWLCLSATLTAGAESYVHDVCGFKEKTLRASVSIRRKNINLMVSTVTRPDFEHLHDLIPPRFIRARDIPKTLIFVDSVTEAILIARSLREKLHQYVQHNTDLVACPKFNPETVIQTYFSPNDENAKSATLRTIRNGATRICVCTDAFGLGVNIPDIVRVIQWGVSPLLNTSSLFQRIGRAARDPGYLGIAVIYVGENIMKSMPKECNNVDDLFHETRATNEETPDSDSDEMRLIPMLKKGKMERLLLPVEETNSVQVRNLLRELYDRANDILEANRAAQTTEKVTTAGIKGTGITNIDPGVLWVIATKGCRWRALLSIFRDVDALASSRDSWCCDICAHHCGLQPEIQTHAIPLTQSTVYFVPAIPTNEPSKIRRKKDKEDVAPKNRPSALCKERAEQLREALFIWRQVAFDYLQLPKGLLSCVVLPDLVIEHLVKKSSRIVTIDRLRTELGAAKVSASLKQAKFRVESSLLTTALVERLFKHIDVTLDPGPPPPKPTGPGVSSIPRTGNGILSHKLISVAPTAHPASAAQKPVASRAGPKKTVAASPPSRPPKRTIQQSMLDRREIEAAASGITKRRIILTEKAGGTS